MDATPNELFERTARLRRLNVQRVQRCRARKRKGARVLRIEIADADLDGFVTLGVLPAERRNDPVAIRHALATLCWLGCRHWPEKAP